MEFGRVVITSHRTLIGVILPTLSRHFIYSKPWNPVIKCPIRFSSCRLQCPFIDIPSSMMEHTDNKFHKDQIELAMHALVKSIKHRSSFVKPWQIAESIEPDIRWVGVDFGAIWWSQSYAITLLGM